MTARETMWLTGEERPQTSDLRPQVRLSRTFLKSEVCGLKSGFTLVEILVVIAIMGVILSTSLPALSHYAGQVRLKTTARELMGLFSLARSSAITSRASRTIRIDPGEGEAVIQETLEEAEPRRVRLHSSVRVEVQVNDRQIPGLRSPGALRQQYA